MQVQDAVSGTSLFLSNISTKSTSLKLSCACLQVLGERELLRQEVQKELAAAADAELGPKFLHIVVKLGAHRERLLQNGIWPQPEV